MSQGVDPEFKPQCHKKEKKKSLKAEGRRDRAAPADGRGPGHQTTYLSWHTSHHEEKTLARQKPCFQVPNLGLSFLVYEVDSTVAPWAG
jgi:hypothetical protein